MFGDTPTDQQKTDDQTSDNNSSMDTAPGLGLGVNPDPDSSISTGAISQDDNLSSSSSDSDAAAASPPPSSDDADSDVSEPTDNLSRIKKQALEELSPLVNKLDQTPEEKYKTLIMMVQASDNQDLLSEAYEAAQKISDEKAKAEALLTIVNEINYFTQK